MIPPIYLGEPMFSGKGFTRVEPLAVAREGAWRTGRDWPEVFPNEGRVFAPRQPPFNTAEVFAFDTEPNNRVGKNLDLRLVAEWTAVEEVLDFRDHDAEVARHALVEIGRTALAPGTTHVIVALAGGVCARVPMDRRREGPTYRARLQGLDAIPIHTFNAAVFDGDQIRGRILSVPGVTLGPQLMTINWCGDSEFLEVVLKRLRKVVAAGVPPVPLARMGDVAAYLTRAGLMPTLGTDLGPLRSRLPSFAATLGDNLTSIDQILDVISSLPPVASRLDTYLAERRTSLETELRAELEERLRSEVGALERELASRRVRVETELAELRASGDLAREEAIEAKVGRDELQSALRDELLALHGELEDLPPDSRTDVRALAGHITARLRARGSDVEFTPDEVPPWSRTQLKAQADTRPWSDAVATIEAAARRYGYLAPQLRVADAAVRSGAVVVLPQAEASRFVRCYAAIMARGEVVRQALDPAILSVDDLWRQPSGGKPTPFATAWSAARLDMRRYRVVLLDGLQRTPMDLWLPSLIDVLATPDRPQNLLIFASLSEGAIDRARVWREIETASIPLLPTVAAGISAEVLAAVMRTEGAVTSFDAEAAPGPDRGELLAFAEGYPGEPEPSAIRRATGILRAAWALTPAVDAAEVALAFASGANEDNAYAASVRSGADWLRSITSTWE